MSDNECDTVEDTYKTSAINVEVILGSGSMYITNGSFSSVEVKYCVFTRLSVLSTIFASVSSGFSASVCLAVADIFKKNFLPEMYNDSWPLETEETLNSKGLPAWALRAEAEWGFSAALLVQNNPHLRNNALAHPASPIHVLFFCTSVLIFFVYSLYGF